MHQEKLLLRDQANQLKKELRQLKDWDRFDLRSRWVELYRWEPPPRASRQFMAAAIAYKMQEQVLGGLKRNSQAFLDKVANNKIKEGNRSPIRVIKSGTKLIREWHGRIYEVIIADEGVVYNGRMYQSLTQVARMITGVKWSGPRFFGIKQDG